MMRRTTSRRRSLVTTVTIIFVVALLAVPMLATFKILCDHLEPLAPIGEFLGD